MQERSRAFIRVFLKGFIAIILCVVAILASFAFLIMNGKGEPANLKTAQRVTREFLESIHTGDIELAHSMLSEKFSPSITVDQFGILIHRDNNVFGTYRKWEICDWGFFMSDGYVIDTSGFLYYEGARIVTKISLHKDSDSIWRIQGLNLRPDITPTPFGMCK
jgi:hypothetical protein